MLEKDDPYNGTKVITKGDRSIFQVDLAPYFFAFFYLTQRMNQCLVTGFHALSNVTSHDFRVVEKSTRVVLLVIRSLAGGSKPPLLNHPKHIAHVLEQNPGDVGDGVDVVFGVVGKVGAAH